MADTILHTGSFIDYFGSEITVIFYTRGSSPTPPTPVSYLSVSPTSLSFIGGGERKGVTVTNISGTLSYSCPSWATVTMSAYGSARPVFVSAAANSTSSFRTGYLRLNDNISSVLVFLSQAEGNWVTINPPIIQLGYSSGSTTVFISGNTSWTHQFDYFRETGWLSLTSTETSDVYTLTYGTNMSIGASRGAELQVLFSGGIASAIITQEPNIAPGLSVSFSTMSFPAEGGNGGNTVTNIEGTLTYTKPSWITINESGQGGTRLVGVHATSNLSTDYRTGSIVFNDDRDNSYTMVTVALSQAGATPTPVNPLTATPDFLSFIAAGERKGVTVTNISGTLSYTNPEWVTVSAYPYGDSRPVFVSAAENTSTSGRSGNLVLNDNNNIPFTVALTQEGTYPALSLSYSSMSFNADGTNKYNVVTNICGTLTYTKPSWITISETDGGLSKLLNVRASVNESTVARSGDVVFDDDRNNPLTMPVTQESVGPLTVSPEQTVLLSTDAATQAVTLSNVIGTPIKTTSATWIVIDSGVKSGTTWTYNVSISANTSTNTRLGGINFQDDRGFVYRTGTTFYQEGTYGVLSLATTDLSFGSAAASDSIKVTNYLGSWVTVATSDTWYTTRVADYGNVYVMVSVADNSGQERTGSFTVDDSRNSPVTVTVTQAGGTTPSATFTVSPTDWTYTAAPDAKTLTISGLPEAGYDYEITYLDGDNWIIVDTFAYNIIFTAKRNETGSSRRVKFTIYNKLDHTDYVECYAEQEG